MPHTYFPQNIDPAESIKDFMNNTQSELSRARLSTDVLTLSHFRAALLQTYAPQTHLLHAVEAAHDIKLVENRPNVTGSSAEGLIKDEKSVKRLGTALFELLQKDFSIITLLLGCPKNTNNLTEGTDWTEFALSGYLTSIKNLLKLPELIAAFLASLLNYCQDYCNFCAKDPHTVNGPVYKILSLLFGLCAFLAEGARLMLRAIFSPVKSFRAALEYGCERNEDGTVKSYSNWGYLLAGVSFLFTAAFWTTVVLVSLPGLPFGLAAWAPIATLKASPFLLHLTQVVAPILASFFKTAIANILLGIAGVTTFCRLMFIKNPADDKQAPAPNAPPMGDSEAHAAAEDSCNSQPGSSSSNNEREDSTALQPGLFPQPKASGASSAQGAAQVDNPQQGGAYPSLENYGRFLAHGIPSSVAYANLDTGKLANPSAPPTQNY